MAPLKLELAQKKSFRTWIIIGLKSTELYFKKTYFQKQYCIFIRKFFLGGQVLTKSSLSWIHVGHSESVNVNLHHVNIWKCWWCKCLPPNQSHLWFYPTAPGQPGLAVPKQYLQCHILNLITSYILDFVKRYFGPQFHHPSFSYDLMIINTNFYKASTAPPRQPSFYPPPPPPPSPHYRCTHRGKFMLMNSMVAITLAPSTRVSWSGYTHL